MEQIKNEVLAMENNGLVVSFVTIWIFAGTDLKNEKGSDTRQKGQRDTPTYILLCKC